MIISNKEASKLEDANCIQGVAAATLNRLACSEIRFDTPENGTITPFGIPVEPEV